jgi:hypothetical protein
MPTIDLQAQLTKPSRIRTISFENPVGEESTDVLDMDTEAPVWIQNVEDESLNTDIKTEVLHAQSLQKNQI